MIWKQHKVYKKYEISEYGDVRKINSIKNRKFRKDKYGYFRLNLYHNGKLITVHPHKLVADIYLTNKKETVNHKDGNKENNHYTNLEYMSFSENTSHSWNAGLQTSAIPVTINGVQYKSKREAERMTGMCRLYL